MNAIPKKVYTYASGIANTKLEPFEVIFRRWFQFKNCFDLYKLDHKVNEYSVADYIMISANTTGQLSNVIVEYKRRYHEQHTYNTILVDKQKIDSLNTLSILLKAPVLFVNELTDCIVIHWLNFEQNNYQLDSIIDSGKLKEVYHLDLMQATILEKPWLRIIEF